MEFIMSLIRKLFQNSSVKDVKIEDMTGENKVSNMVAEIVKRDMRELGEVEDAAKYQEENKTKRTEFFEPIKYKNDSEILMDEFIDLTGNNNELINLLIELNKYTNRNFKKPILLTMVFRTQAQQDYLYRNSARYKKKKFISPHQLWHGADIRSHSFTKSEIEQIEAWINNKYNSKNYYKWTAKYHNNGNGNHFHIQFVKK